MTVDGVATTPNDYALAVPIHDRGYVTSEPRRRAVARLADLDNMGDFCRIRFRRAAENHDFVYVIVSARFASMAVIATTVATSAILQWVVGACRLDRISNDDPVFLPMAMLPEGFINVHCCRCPRRGNRSGRGVSTQFRRSFENRDYIGGKQGRPRALSRPDEKSRQRGVAGLNLHALCRSRSLLMFETGLRQR